MSVIVKSVLGARAAIDALAQDDKTLRAAEAVGELLVARLKAGQKIMVVGNGGSACDAAHFAEELTGRYQRNRRALAAMACTDAGHITCTANDFGFEHVFSRWVEGLGRAGDVLVLLSTSGNSANILRARESGAAIGMTTVGLLGRDGGKMRGTCDHEVIVTGGGGTSDRIQELHKVIIHGWCEMVDGI
ncbi:MAG: SIS domain-containing protein [Phycisphaerales bacterium]|jgi:D-sedoheptulose 7-phosphate isomerase